MKLPYRGILCIVALLAAVFLLPQSRPFAQSSYPGGSSGGSATPSYSYGATPTPGGTPAPGYSSPGMVLQSGPEGSFYYSGYLYFKVPLSLTGHSFAFKYQSGAGTVTSGASVAGVITVNTGVGGTPVALYLVVTAPQPTTTQFNPATTDWWLSDTTGQLEPFGGHRSYDLRARPWRTVSGAPNRYFAIPDARVGHSLFAGFPQGGWTTVSAGPVVWTYGAYPNTQPVSLHYLVGLAPSMGLELDDYLYLVDRTENRKTPWGKTDVRAAADWTFDPDYATFPKVHVRVAVEAWEAGHNFTVHSKLAGLQETQTPCVAQAGAAGTSGCVLPFDVGSGLQFWITRDAENGRANQPAAPTTGTWAAGTNASVTLTFSAIGRFPAPPQRLATPVPHLFRVNASTRPGHIFSVRMNDGYTTIFGDIPYLDVANNVHVPAYGFDTIAQWDNVPLSNPLPIITFTAMIDPTRATLFRDESIAPDGGLAQSITVDPDVNFTDVFDGWVHVNVPPPAPTITLRVPASKLNDGFQLFAQATQPAAWPWPVPPPSYAWPTPLPPIETVTYIGVDGMADYAFTYYSLTLANPTPYHGGPFTLQDMATLQPHDVSAGENDLRAWLKAPAVVNLQISTSRTDHRLRVRHPNGEFFDITHPVAADNSSLGPNRVIATVPYYYFDATSLARTEMPWYVEDLDTGERIGPTTGLTYPDNDALIMWIALPTPDDLTGTITAQGTAELQWSLPPLASDQGAFEVQRKLSGESTWQTLEPSVPADGVLHYADDNLTVGADHYYRVRYTFGGRRSAASNVVHLTGWMDGDGDGLPDAWEVAWGLNPHNAADARAWLIGDGRTSVQLFHSGVTIGALNAAASAASNTTSNAAGNPPQWEMNPLLDLRWEIRGGISMLVWDVPPATPGTVRIEYEIDDNNWVLVNSVPAASGQFAPPTPPARDAERADHRTGPALNEPANYRLRGDFTSNETAVKFRLMMKTARVSRSQPGIREFDVSGNPSPSLPLRRYFNTCIVEELWSTNQVGSTGSLWDWRSTDSIVEINQDDASLQWQEDVSAGGGSAAPGGRGSAYSWSTNHWGVRDMPLEDDNTLSFGNSSQSEGSTWSTTSSTSSIGYESASGDVTVPFHIWQIAGPPLWEQHGYDNNAASSFYAWSKGGTDTGGANGPVTYSDSGTGYTGGAEPLGFPGYANSGTSPTSVTVNQSSESYSYSYTATLSDEYTLASFLADTRAMLPDFLSVRGDRITWSGGFNTWNARERFPRRVETMDSSLFDNPPPTVITSERYLSADGKDLDLLRTEYWFECNDCGRQPAVVIAEYQENYDPGMRGTPASGARQIVRATTLTPGATPGKAQTTPARPADMTDASQNGRRYFSPLPVDIVPDDGVAGVVGDMVPSKNGATGERHFVSPKKTTEIADDYVVLKATGVTSELFQSTLEWEGGEAVPSEPLKRRVKRDTTGKTEVKIKVKSSGQVVKKLNVWVVWTNGAKVGDRPIATQTLSLVAFESPPYVSSGLEVRGGYNFKFTIQPASIITDPTERPELGGSNEYKGTTVDPPGTGLIHHMTGFDLKDGAKFKWDVSRRIRIKILNPHLYPKNKLLFLNGGTLWDNQPKAEDIFESYPTDDRIGNDDPRTGDEDNNPYEASTRTNLSHAVGEVTSSDAPSLVMPHTTGADGETFELRRHFGEFVRLLIGSKWYRCSDRIDWRSHLKIKRQGGVWVNDASDLALDNAGF